MVHTVKVSKGLLVLSVSLLELKKNYNNQEFEAEMKVILRGSGKHLTKGSPVFPFEQLQIGL